MTQVRKPGGHCKVAKHLMFPTQSNILASMLYRFSKNTSLYSSMYIFLKKEVERGTNVKKMMIEIL